MTSTERKFRSNAREIRRLQSRVNSGLGRNASATLNALDRRLEMDRKLLADLAAEDDG